MEDAPSVAKDAGMSRTKVWQLRKLAQYPEIVEAVIAESTDEHPASMARVMAAIAEYEGRPAAAGKCICPDCGALHRRKGTQ